MGLGLTYLVRFQVAERAAAALALAFSAWKALRFARLCIRGADLTVRTHDAPPHLLRARSLLVRDRFSREVSGSVRVVATDWIWIKRIGGIQCQEVGE